jgi:sugar phosphate isomerase/epimerase
MPPLAERIRKEGARRSHLWDHFFSILFASLLYNAERAVNYDLYQKGDAVMARIRHKIAAQLYTVRDEMAHDFKGVIRELAAMGFQAVQFSGLAQYDVHEVAATFREHGLETAGTHVNLPRFFDDFPGVLKEAEILGTRDVILPYLGSELQNAQGYAHIRQELRTRAQIAGEQGFRVSYHHHNFEFRTQIDGVPALAWLLAEDPGAAHQVNAEFDVYWLLAGGVDPLEFMRPYANRVPILHVKDMTADDRKAFAEVGTGRINFVPILAWGETAGVEFYAIEQDVCPGNPLDSLRLSLTNMLAMEHAL